MVLQELGGKLTAALQKMQSVTVISEEVLDKMLKDIAAALLEADVNVRVVGQLRKAIKTRAALEEEVAGANRRKLIQRAVVDELVNIVDPGVQPHEVKKGKPNVIMFVGLQGAGNYDDRQICQLLPKKGFKCCMVCADTFRAGATTSSGHNSRSCDVPSTGVIPADPVAIAAGRRAVSKEKYEVIIVDTSDAIAGGASRGDAGDSVRSSRTTWSLCSMRRRARLHEQATSFMRR